MRVQAGKGGGWGGDNAGMEIAFADRVLRTVCENGDVALLGIDAEVSDALRDRLADLRAADSVLGMPGIEVMTGEDPEPTAQIALVAGYSLIAKANHRQPARAQDGTVDWTRVRRIQITRISRM